MEETPEWLEALVDSVSSCMQPHNLLGPLGYRWGDEDDFWEVTIYPTPTELVGGAEDGAIVAPGFSLNVQKLCSVFEELEDVCWLAQAFGPHDEYGQHLSVEGVYEGHQIFLQILSEAPAGEEPHLRVDVSEHAG